MVQLRGYFSQYAVVEFLVLIRAPQLRCAETKLLPVMVKLHHAEQEFSPKLGQKADGGGAADGVFDAPGWRKGRWSYASGAGLTMRTIIILTLIILLTLWGDYLIKQAADRPNGLTSLALLVGGLFYGITAIGWFFLMRSHSLAAVGVFYSSMSLLLLAGLGYFAFKEAFGPREAVSVSLALLSIIVMGGDH